MPAAFATFELQIAMVGSCQLDDLSSQMWRLVAAGAISDEQAEILSTAINKRRAALKPANASAKAVGQISCYSKSHFKPRQHPRSPDREASRNRRRRLGGSGALPDVLRCCYTESQRAVLCIVAGEIKARGTCDAPIDKIAALAGVCRSTVQTALHEARRLGHITIMHRPRTGQKSLTNLVKIISAEWLAWIKRGPKSYGEIGSKLPRTGNLLNTTKSLCSSKGKITAAENQQRAWQEVHGTKRDAYRYKSHVPIGPISQKWESL